MSNKTTNSKAVMHIMTFPEKSLMGKGKVKYGIANFTISLFSKGTLQKTLLSE